MKSLGFIAMMMLMFACNNQKEQTPEEEESGEFNYENFSARFKEVTLPYQISDTGLLDNNDTAGIRNASFAASIPDSIKQKLVGKTTGLKMVPLAKFSAPKAEQYYIIKVISGNKKAVMLTVFDKEGSYAASIPFLIPDAKSETNQMSSVDKSFSISRSINRRTKDDVVIEGKDVYVFNNEAKDFILIMTDLLDDSEQELINPIDTFGKVQKYTGDYTNGKRNMVSVRDGRTENERNIFIHFEKSGEECIGELKGTVLMTSSNTAAFRGAGNPCVLEITFATNKVTLKEVEGCGSFRDLKCTFDGTYTRKKETKPKAKPAD